MRKTIKLSTWRVFLKEPPQRWREPALQSNLHPAPRRASSQTSQVTKRFVSSLWADLDLLEPWSTQQSTLLPHVTNDAAGRQMCLRDAPAPGPSRAPQDTSCPCPGGTVLSSKLPLGHQVPGPWPLQTRPATSSEQDTWTLGS